MAKLFENNWDKGILLPCGKVIEFFRNDVGMIHHIHTTTFSAVGFWRRQDDLTNEEHSQNVQSRNRQFWGTQELIALRQQNQRLLETLRTIDAVANFGHADELSAINFKLIRQLIAEAMEAVEAADAAQGGEG